MKRKGIVYNVSRIEETLAENNIKVVSYIDGVERAHKQFEKLSDAMYWITQINMVARCALAVQINIDLTLENNINQNNQQSL